MNKILKYFKKNIYLVCLILALSYIAYNKLYKLYRKEGLENSGYENLFGKKDERTVIKDIDTDVAIEIDLRERKQTEKVWVDLNSVKVNGSKKLAIVDANQYDVVKKQLNTCQDVNIQNINLKNDLAQYKNDLAQYKNDLAQYKNKGFFARLFNW